MRVLAAALSALVAALVCVVWMVAVWCVPYDYDEITQLHTVWLVSTGGVPYSDFLQVKPPTFWLLLSPLLSLWGERPDALLALRGVAVLGHLAFLGAVVAHARVGRPVQERGWTAALLALFALSGDALLYLAEARMDSWAYALLLWAAYPLRVRAATPPRRVGFAAAGSFAAFLEPKVLLLAPISIAFELLSSARRAVRRLVPGAAAYLLGVGLAVLLALSVLAAAEVDPRLLVERVIVFHVRFNELTRGGAFRQALLAHGALVGLVLLGAAHRIWRRVSAGEPLGWYESALLAFLVIQLLVVSPPYKQYTVPWLLLGLHFALQLPQLARPLALRRFAEVALLVAALAAAANAWLSLGPAASRRAQEHLMTRLAGLVDRDAHVVAPVMAHPVFRRDVFYAWFSTSDFSGSRDFTEALLAADPDMAERARPEGYLQRLEALRPALLVAGLDGGFDAFLPNQAVALGWYVEREGDAYRRRRVAGRVVYVLRDPR